MKKIKILIFVAALAAIAFCLAGCKKPDASGEPSGPDYISGSYALSINNAGSALYEFEADGTGSLAYSDSNGDVVNESFTYEIKGELGERTITFVWKESGKTTTHSFATGSENGRDTVYINDEVYFKN